MLIKECTKKKQQNYFFDFFGPDED